MPAVDGHPSMPAISGQKANLFKNTGKGTLRPLATVPTCDKTKEWIWQMSRGVESSLFSLSWGPSSLGHVVPAET